MLVHTSYLSHAQHAEQVSENKKINGLLVWFLAQNGAGVKKITNIMHVLVLNDIYVSSSQR